MREPITFRFDVCSDLFSILMGLFQVFFTIIFVWIVSPFGIEVGIFATITYFVLFLIHFAIFNNYCNGDGAIEAYIWSWKSLLIMSLGIVLIFIHPILLITYFLVFISVMSFIIFNLIFIKTTDKSVLASYVFFYCSSGIYEEESTELQPNIFYKSKFTTESYHPGWKCRLPNLPHHMNRLNKKEDWHPKYLTHPDKTIRELARKNIK